MNLAGHWAFPSINYAFYDLLGGVFVKGCIQPWLHKVSSSERGKINSLYWEIWDLLLSPKINSTMLWSCGGILLRKSEIASVTSGKPFLKLLKMFIFAELWGDSSESSYSFLAFFFLPFRYFSVCIFEWKSGDTWVVREVCNWKSS